MSTVTLKSKYGPVYFIDRPSPFEKNEYNFSLDNDCRCRVPASVWEKLKERYFDKSLGLKYKEAFIEL